MDVIRCANNYCGTCATNQAASDCFDYIKTNQCQPYLIADATCANALQTKQTQLDNTCFSAGDTQADYEAFFKAIATEQCP